MIRRLRAAWLAFREPEAIETRDGLTGALTRKTFLRVANRELARTQRGGYPLSLIFVDLDGLKVVNDKRGHKAGDSLLKIFAQTTLSHMRPYDLLARWGGDEFVLLFPTTTSLAAEKIIGRICGESPEFSWGISEWRKEDNMGLLIERADEEMYKRKQAKKANESGLNI